MRLLLRRSSIPDRFGGLHYRLTVELFTLPQEDDVIRTHRLDRHTAYVIQEAVEYQRRATAALERDRGLSVFHDGRAVLHANLSAAYYWLRTRLAFSVTVADMRRGTAINCPSLDQLVACEREIIAAFDTLKVTVDDALAFDQGREQLLAPDAEDDAIRAAPATWRPNHRIVR